MGKGTLIVTAVRLPIFYQVGVGGLEPPTSASQTRRAGRLRYTPADKSIIRSMYKGQAPPHTFARYFIMLILSFFCMLWMVGCSPETPSLTPGQPIPPTTSEPKQPSQASTMADTDSEVPIPTTSTPDCLSAGGTLQDESFFSDLLRNDFSYKVYLPPCYDAEPLQKYPVLYLLYGLSYDNDQWIRLGLTGLMDDLVQNEELSPFIVVLPKEAPFDPPELSLYGDAIVEELISHVDNSFRTLDEKTYRGIGGLSRGASWSVRIGFEHYELFSKVGAHSLPLFQSDVSDILSWLTQIPEDDLPIFFIDIGRDDREWQSAQAFADQLDQNGIPHNWYLFNQGHSESYWSDHLKEYLLWYGKDW